MRRPHVLEFDCVNCYHDGCLSDTQGDLLHEKQCLADMSFETCFGYGAVIGADCDIF